MAGGFRSGHVYWRNENGAEPMQGARHVLVVENEIRSPNVSRRNSDLFNASIIVWVPMQVHVFPLL